MITNLEDQLNDTLRNKCYNMLKLVQQTKPVFRYWRIVSDTGYYSNQPAQIRVEFYGISAAQPSWDMPSARSIEGAIKLAEEKLGISSVDKHFLYSDDRIQGHLLNAESIIKRVEMTFDKQKPIAESRIIELNKWLSNAVIGDYCKIAEATIARVGKSRVSI